MGTCIIVSENSRDNRKERLLSFFKHRWWWLTVEHSNLCGRHTIAYIYGILWCHIVDLCCYWELLSSVPLCSGAGRVLCTGHWLFRHSQHPELIFQPRVILSSSTCSTVHKLPGFLILLSLSTSSLAINAASTVQKSATTKRTSLNCITLRIKLHGSHNQLDSLVPEPWGWILSRDDNGRSKV